MIYSLPKSPKTLVFADIRIIPKFERGHLDGVKWGWGRYELAIFDLYATVLGNGAR